MSSAVLVSCVSTCAAVRLGSCDQIRAAMPAAKGEAIDVPLMGAYLSDVGS